MNQNSNVIIAALRHTVLMPIKLGDVVAVILRGLSTAYLDPTRISAHLKTAQTFYDESKV